jgi:hypothetical protein
VLLAVAWVVMGGGEARRQLWQALLVEAVDDDDDDDDGDDFDEGRELTGPAAVSTRGGAAQVVAQVGPYCGGVGWEPQ